MKQAVVTPIGIVRQPNKFGVAPTGSMSDARNIMFRKPNVIEPFTAFQGYASYVPGTPSPRIRALFPCDMSTLAVTAGSRSALTGDTDFCRWLTPATASAACMFAYNGSTASPTFKAGTARMTRSRGRFIVDSQHHPVVFDTEGSVTPRLAGMPTATGIVVSQVAGSTWANNTQARFCSVFRKKQSDGYEIQGAPSQQMLVHNTSGGAVSPSIVVTFSTTLPIVAGDIVDIYRTAFTSTSTDPGVELFLCASRVITAGDLTPITFAGVGAWTYYNTAAIPDLTVDAALIQPLYTNANEEGALAGNYPPPHSYDTFTFRNATFYNAQRGLQSFTVQVPTGFGVAGLGAVTTGIGRRSYSGDLHTSTLIDAIANTTGIAVGQYVSGTGVVAGSRVTAVTAASITLDTATTTTSGAVTIFTYDVIEIDGRPIKIATDPQATLVNASITSVTLLSDSFGPALGLGTIPNGGELIFLRTVPYADAASGAGDGTFTVRATNGSNYSPALPAIGATPLYSSGDPRTNRLFYSKPNQPEHVPTRNFIDVGHETILRTITTRDAAFVFCTDGIFRVSGDGVTFRDDPFDLGTILLCANAADSLGEVIYAWTNMGITAVGDNVGAKSITQDFIADDMRLLWEQVAGTPSVVSGKVVTPLRYSWTMQIACDKYHSEVWATCITNDGTTLADTAYVFNQDQTCWTQYDTETSACTVYADYLRAMMIASDASTACAVRYYYPDATRTQTGTPTFTLNPMFGGEPTTLKEWQDVELIFDGMSGTVAAQLTFNGQAYPSTVDLTAKTGDARYTVPVQQIANYTGALTVGFSTATLTVPWRFFGMSVRYREVAEQDQR